MRIGAGMDAGKLFQSGSQLSQNDLVKRVIVDQLTIDNRAADSGRTENKHYLNLTEAEKKDLPISEKVVIEAIERANRAILGGNRKFEFSIHEKTKQIMIKVINSDTNEIVREIPPEKILDMVATMWEMAGLIVDERR